MWVANSHSFAFHEGFDSGLNLACDCTVWPLCQDALSKSDKAAALYVCLPANLAGSGALDKMTALLPESPAMGAVTLDFVRETARS